MPSEKQQRQNSYLHGVLINGVRPFLYRRGASSLLGFPDGDRVNRTRSPISPRPGSPVSTVNSGLNSRTSIHARRANGFPLSLEKEQAARFSDKSVEESAELDRQKTFLPVKGSRNDRSDSFQENKSEKGDANKIHQESVPKPEQAIRSSTAADKSKEPVVVFEREEIAIPGVSKASRYESGLLRSKKNHLSSKAHELPRNEASSKTHSGETERDILKNGDSKDKRPDRFVSPSVETVQAEARVKKEPDDPTSKPVLQTAIFHEETQRSSAKQVPLSVRNNTQPVAARKNIESSDPRVPDTPAAFSFSVVSGSGRSTVPMDERLLYQPFGGTRSIGSVTEKLDLLRSPVNKLDFSGSSTAIRKDSEPKVEQREQPPIQQIVVIKRPSNQARAARAFWERSYLRRFHLRLLR